MQKGKPGRGSNGFIAEVQVAANGHEAELAPTDSDLDELVERLENLRSERTLDLAVSVGQLLVTGIYRDLDRFEVLGARHSGYRRFLERPGIRMSPTTLWRSMRVYELCERLPWLRNARGLTVTHMYAILGVPHDTQKNLLARAQQEKWTSEELAQRAAKAKLNDGKRGRPNVLPVGRLVRRLGALGTALRQELVSGSTLSGTELAELDGTLRALREVVETAEQPLARGRGDDANVRAANAYEPDSRADL